MSDEKKLTKEQAEEAITLARRRLREIEIGQLIEQGSFYACSCGWKGNEHSDQCPGCGDWDTIIEVKL